MISTVFTKDTKSLTRSELIKNCDIWIQVKQIIRIRWIMFKIPLLRWWISESKKMKISITEFPNIEIIATTKWKITKTKNSISLQQEMKKSNTCEGVDIQVYFHHQHSRFQRPYEEKCGVWDQWWDLLSLQTEAEKYLKWKCQRRRRNWIHNKE